MLRQIFSIFEPTEKQFTSQALKRLKWATYLAMPCFPIMTLLEADPEIGLSKSATLALLLVALVSVIAFFIIAFSRISWRVWTPDRYLDESEIARKREASAFTMMVYGWGGLAVIIFGWLLSLSGVDVNGIINRFGGPIWWIFLGLVSVSYVHILKLISITPSIDDPDSDVQSVFKDKAFLWALVLFLIAITVVPFVKGYQDGHRDALADIEAAKQSQSHQNPAAINDE